MPLREKDAGQHTRTHTHTRKSHAHRHSMPPCFDECMQRAQCQREHAVGSIGAEFRIKMTTGAEFRIKMTTMMGWGDAVPTFAAPHVASESSFVGERVVVKVGQRQVVIGHAAHRGDVRSTATEKTGWKRKGDEET